MYPIFKEEAVVLLEKLRKIRKDAGEIISFLEHYLQLHGEKALTEIHYNPDDYLERLALQSDSTFSSNLPKKDSEVSQNV